MAARAGAAVRVAVPGAPMFMPPVVTPVPIAMATMNNAYWLRDMDHAAGMAGAVCPIAMPARNILNTKTVVTEAAETQR